MYRLRRRCCALRVWRAFEDSSGDECEDGQLAVEHLIECMNKAHCPDLILLDMQMPNLDGYETARALRKLGYASPIIALTADAMQGDMKECIAVGCNDYLSKPIDAERLVAMVKQLTHEARNTFHHSTNENPQSL